MAFWQSVTNDEFGTRTTKLDLISYNEAEQLKKQRFGYRCSWCNRMLETEFDFAAHYTVGNSEFKNLGECPVKLQEEKRLAEFAEGQPLD